MTERSTPQNRSSRASCSRGQRWPAPPPRPDGVRLKRFGRAARHCGLAVGRRSAGGLSGLGRADSPRGAVVVLQAHATGEAHCLRRPHGTLGHGGHRLAVLPRHPQSGHADFAGQQPRLHARDAQSRRSRVLPAKPPPSDRPRGRVGAPGVITFTGMRQGDQRRPGLQNCVEGWKQIIGYAEQKQVMGAWNTSTRGTTRIP